jgi:hypothetical protein
MPGRRRRTELDLAIETLLSASTEHFERQKALFVLVSHLRWPYLSKEQERAERVMLARYLCEKAQTGIIDPAVLWQHVDLTFVLADLTHSGDPDFPFFMLPQDRYDMPRLIADTVRFLLAWKPETTNRRKAASLSKAHKLIEAGQFAHQPISWRHFIEQWGYYKSCASLHYVNEYLLRGRLNLHPGSAKFTADVDKLLKDNKTFQIAFGQAKFIQSRLHALLPHVWDDVDDLPLYPSSLPTVEVSPPPLNTSMIEVLKKKYKMDPS